MSTDRFGWHPEEATVKLVPGVAELPDQPQEPKKGEKDPPKKGDK